MRTSLPLKLKRKEAMNFIEELKWRGMLYEHTPDIEDALVPGAKAYIGFDPTAPSLTIGNYVTMMMLKLFQRHGHQSIMLFGGATGRIGDPSGKTNERDLLPLDVLESNLEKQKSQAECLLKEDAGQLPVQFVNNYDHYKDMNVLDFLRDVGKTLTVNYMMAKDSVKTRLETGITFTEFSYQLLQAYDFQVLHETMDCYIQMGGSDQWGNITSGTEFIRRNLNKKAYAITCPLLTKSDGSKFGKSSTGNIWLSADLTSPYQFYQFWINADDADIEKYLKYFSLKPLDEIQQLIDASIEDPRGVKQQLAEEMCARIHGEENMKAVEDVSQLLFNKQLDQAGLQVLSESAYQMIGREIPTITLSHAQWKAGTQLTELLVGTENVFSSNGDLRRSIKGNALSINKQKITDYDMQLSADDLIKEKYLMVENGKKNKYLVRLEQ